MNDMPANTETPKTISHRRVKSNMNKEAIINRKVILLKAGLSNTAAGKALGVSPQAIYNEIAWRFSSRRVREGLCELTNTTPDEFWPDYIPPDKAAESPIETQHTADGNHVN